MKFAAVLAAVPLLATGARAQIKTGTQQASLALGVANPVSDEIVDGQDTEFGQTGATLGLGYLYQIRRNLSIGGDINIKALGDKDIVTKHGPATIKSSAWTSLAIARGDLAPDSRIRPYGLIGLGIGGAKRETTFVNRPDLNNEQTSTGFAFAMGVGVDYDINASWLAGAEVRYNIIGTDEGAIGADNVRTLDMLFKAGYKF